MANEKTETTKDAEIWAQVADQIGVTLNRATLDKTGRVGRLDLSYEGLQALPPEIGQLSSLTSLNLSGNQLQALPPEIGQLSSLTSLKLWDNQLQALPPEIGQLSSLTEFNLGRNQLQALPPEIGQLSSLTSLYLGDNQLQALPPEIGQLSSLTSLYLWNNQLQALPPEIGQLSSLTELYMWGNPLETLPREIVGQGTKAILDYLQALLGDSLLNDTFVRYEAKLLMVGEGGTGKSSILSTLQGQPFIEGRDTTHGIDVAQLQLDHPFINDMQIKLNVWDFGGQEIYHATHQFFLTEQSLYLVVWNARLGSDQGKLDYWLNLIKSLAPDSPVLLVATHAVATNPDEREPDINYQAYKEAYPNIVGGLSVSNRTGQGFEELKRAIAQESAKLRLVGEAWPRKWVKAEHALVNMPEHHIDADKYVECCERFGVDRSVAKGTLGLYLYYLGKILYFPEDDQLANIVVLKPNWITKAISKVLENPETRKHGGVLRHDHLPQIWIQDENGVAYDRHLFPAFLRLMEKFDLSYEIETALPGEPRVSLIPQLLPHQPPDQLAHWPQEPINGEIELKMEYKLDFLPAGIMSWVIVRTHHYTEGAEDLHWRDGVILGYGGHRAKVELNKYLQTVTLIVHGPSPYNFFTILMNTLDLIMARFPGLSIERRIPCICHRHGGKVKPCSRYHSYEDLVRLMERQRHTIECLETFVNVPVNEMLFGIHWSTMEDVLSRLND
jgi:internalin A